MYCGCIVLYHAKCTVDKQTNNRKETTSEQGYLVVRNTKDHLSRLIGNRNAIHEVSIPLRILHAWAKQDEETETRIIMAR